MLQRTKGSEGTQIPPTSTFHSTVVVQSKVYPLPSCHQVPLGQSTSRTGAVPPPRYCKSCRGKIATNIRRSAQCHGQTIGRRVFWCRSVRRAQHTHFFCLMWQDYTGTWYNDTVVNSRFHVDRRGRLSGLPVRQYEAPFTVFTRPISFNGLQGHFPNEVDKGTRYGEARGRRRDTQG